VVTSVDSFAVGEARDGSLEADEMMRKKESGNILVFTAIGLTVLLGMAGLAVDVGALRHDKRLQQSAADAAAIAGATNLAWGGVVSGARAASTANGFTDGTNNVTVTVSDPATGPTKGPHTGDPKYVEVFVTAIQPTYFMRIFGVTTATITTRAVATNTSGGDNTGCLYTLGTPTASIEGVNINGNATLNATTCGIVDNGNFNTKGNALDVNAGTFGIAGSWNKNGPGGTVSCAESSTCPVEGMPSSGDPMASVPNPCPCTGGTAWNGGGVIPPGTYSSINIGNGTATMSGTYYVTGAGGLTVGGNGTINATNTTIFFDGTATFTAVGTPTINMAPPSTGTYAGILMYQTPSDISGPSFGGNTGATYGGVLYFPKAQVTFFGNNTTLNTGIVIADALALSGNPTVNLQGQLGLPTGVSVIKNAILVE
jgi:hypothetical protein